MKQFLRLKIPCWSFFLAVIVVSMAGCDNGDKAKITHLKAENADLKNRVESGSASSQLETENAELKSKLEALSQANQGLQEKLRLASQQQEQRQTRETEKPQQPPSTGELQVKLLKLFDYGAGAEIDFQIKNNSDKFLERWEIGGDVYDSGGKYLGHGVQQGYNLRTGQSATASMLFGDIHSADVAKWDPQIRSVSAGSPGGGSTDMTANFQLTLVP